MAGRTASVTVEVLTDTAKAQQALRDYGSAADTAATKSRDVAGGVDAVGGTAAQATTGLRDLGGAMAEAGGTMGSLGSAMVTGSIAFEALDGAATLYAAAQGVASGAAKAFTTVMNVMKVAILTNPIFIIAAVIIAIGAALVIAYKKSETFRNIVDGVFRVVSSAASTFWSWIKKIADIVGGVFTTYWAGVKTAAKGFLDAVIGPFETLAGWISDVVDFLGDIKWPSPPGWLKDVGGFIGNLNPFSASAAPSLSTASATQAFMPTGRAGAGGVARSGSGGITVNVMVPPTSNPVEVGRQVVNVIRHFERSAGAGWRNGPVFP